MARERAIQVRVFQHEYDQIKANASQIPISQFLRDLGLSNGADGPFDHDDPMTTRQKAEVQVAAEQGEYEVKVEPGSSVPVAEPQESYEATIRHTDAPSPTSFTPDAQPTKEPVSLGEISKLTKQLEAQGKSPQDAYATARKRLGL